MEERERHLVQVMFKTTDFTRFSDELQKKETVFLQKCKKCFIMKLSIFRFIMYKIYIYIIVY